MCWRATTTRMPRTRTTPARSWTVSVRRVWKATSLPTTRTEMGFAMPTRPQAVWIRRPAMEALSPTPTTHFVSTPMRLVKCVWEVLWCCSTSMAMASATRTRLRAAPTMRRATTILRPPMKTDHALIWMSVACAAARALQRESATVRAMCLTSAVCVEAAAFPKEIAIARAASLTP